MLNEGYVRFFRSITSWEWYDDIPTFRLFTHLLLTCNWQEKKWHGHLIKPGQRVVSLKKLSEETGLSLQAVRTAISHMESTGEVTRFQHGKIGVVAIKNWDKFQEGNTIPNTNINTDVTRNQHGANTELTPIEESKKAIKQEIPPYSPPTGEGFDQFWAAYPKKRSKGAARKAWDKLHVDSTMQATILQAIERAKQSEDWQKDGGQYIPYPATWLNDEGWEDEEPGTDPPPDRPPVKMHWVVPNPDSDNWEDLVP